MRNVLSIAQRGHQHSTGQNPELFDDLVVVFSGMILMIYFSSLLVFYSQERKVFFQTCSYKRSRPVKNAIYWTFPKLHDFIFLSFFSGISGSQAGRGKKEKCSFNCPTKYRRSRPLP